MPDEREPTPRPDAVAREVVVEHDGFARVEGREAGEEPQQRRLPGTVRAREQHDFARVDVEVDTGEGREATEEAHGRAETDDRHTRLRAIEDHECTERRRRGVEPTCRAEPAVTPPLPSSDAGVDRRARRPRRASAASPQLARRDEATHRLDRPCPRGHRSVDPALRRLPAVGHRAPPSPQPGRAREEVRADPAGFGDHHDAHVDPADGSDRTDGRAAHDASTEQRSAGAAATRSASSRSPS